MEKDNSTHHQQHERAYTATRRTAKTPEHSTRDSRLLNTTRGVLPNPSPRKSKPTNLASVVVIELPHEQRPRLVASTEQVPPGGRKAHGRGRERGRPIAGGPGRVTTGIRRPSSEGDAGDVRKVNHPPLDADSARDGGAVVLRPATPPLPGRAVAAGYCRAATAAAAAAGTGAADKLLLLAVLVGVAGIHQKGSRGG